MELGLQGKVALVTGGSRGIGMAIAQRFTEAGATVMISSRKAEGLAAAAAEIEGDVAWYAANVGDPDAAKSCIDATVERLGALDILVNNAGTNPYFGPLVDIDEGRMQKTYEVNQASVLFHTAAAWRHWMRDHGAHALAGHRRALRRTPFTPEYVPFALVVAIEPAGKGGDAHEPLD